MIRRHQALKQSSIFLRNNPELAYYNIEELQEKIQNESRYSILKKLSRYSSNVTGSPAYWFKYCQTLKSLFMTEGSATVFMTYSFSDYHSPDLHRLLGTENASFIEKRKALIKNPHITAWYFYKRYQDWNKYFS